MSNKNAGKSQRCWIIYQCDHRVEPLSNSLRFCSSDVSFKIALDNNTSKDNISTLLSKYMHDIGFVS